MGNVMIEAFYVVFLFGMYGVYAMTALFMVYFAGMALWALVLNLCGVRSALSPPSAWEKWQAARASSPLDLTTLDLTTRGRRSLGPGAATAFDDMDGGV